MEERDGDAYVNFGACHADMNRAFGRTEDDKREIGYEFKLSTFTLLLWSHVLPLTVWGQQLLIRLYIYIYV